MEKNKLIIVEGPQGTGKSTLTNYLRQNIPSSNLISMSGQKDKTITGKEMSIKMYYALIEYLNKMQEIPMNFIFDRTFFSEEIYARLGYKEYSFTDVYNDLLNKLVKLNYDIYYFSLYLEKIQLFEERLKRESHHNYQPFSLESSSNQQKVYRELAKELKNIKEISVNEIAMDNFDVAYKEIRKVLSMK